MDYSGNHKDLHTIIVQIFSWRPGLHKLVLCQNIIVGRDSEIAPTNTQFCRRELRFPTIDYTHKFSLDYPLVLCQNIIVGRDSEIAPTDRLIMVGGNSDSRPFQDHQLQLD